MTGAELFAEIMDKYNEYRAEWIEIYGDDTGFDEWFTSQVLGKEK